MNDKKTPSNIKFSSKVLRFPSLRDFGIDEKITVRLNVESKFEIGNWVERNDEVAIIEVMLYEKKEKPKSFFKSDNTTVWTFSFKSPISGLVIGQKQDYLAQNSYGYSLFFTRNVFPVLLVPEYEPQPTEFNSTAYSDLWKTLSIEWPRMYTWDRDKGDIRIGELYAKDQISNNESQPEFETILEDFSQAADKEYRAEWWSSTDIYRSTIEHLRANNLDLREKLLHLVKENYE